MSSKNFYHCFLSLDGLQVKFEDFVDNFIFKELSTIKLYSWLLEEGITWCTGRKKEAMILKLLIVCFLLKMIYNKVFYPILEDFDEPLYFVIYL